MKRLFIMMTLGVSGLLLFARNDDWGLWTSINAEMKLTKKWELDIVTQYRMNNNIAVTDQIRGSADITRKVGQYVKLGAGYELIAKNKVKKDIFVYRHRFRMQAAGLYKFDRFTASWRTRMQLTLLETDEARGNVFDDDSNKWVWRNRFELKYDIKKTPFKPYVNFELFHRLFNGMEQGYFRNRLSIGTEYRIDKHHTFEAGYKFESEVDGKNMYKLHVIKIAYIYSF